MENVVFNQSIILMGLGPGDSSLVTREAWEIIQATDEIYLRTDQIPIVQDFPQNLKVFSFDEIYQQASSFDEVYKKITEKVLELGARENGVIYAVPGNPCVAESTSFTIIKGAEERGIPLRIVPGMSFIEPTFAALKLDPLPYLTILDALEICDNHVPNFRPDMPALIAQIYSNHIASEIKIILNSFYPDEHQVILVHGAGTKDQSLEKIKLYEIDRSKQIGLVTSLYVPSLIEGSSFEVLCEVIAHLRSPEGCPWDREQTHSSLRQNLLEETYELLTALDLSDPLKIKEELGDLLLQILLHSQIASESGEFNIIEILQTIYRKLINRHPHVFGDIVVESSDMVVKNWERIKAQERVDNAKNAYSLFDGVPLVMPALSLADLYQRRVARVGFDWKDIEGVIEKVNEEIAELQHAIDDNQRAQELGDIFFALANLARWYNLDAESVLREANARFRSRFNRMEKIIQSQGQQLGDLDSDQLDNLWELIKSQND